MTARPRILLATLAAGVAVLRGAAQTQPATPVQTFRTGTDVVVVEVSVRDGNRAVTGLGAEDFVLTDNGVRQQISSVEPTAVPIDVTLVVDLSGNPRGLWEKPAPLTRVTAELRDEVREVTAILRPDDRIRLLAIDRRVQQLWPMQPVSVERAIDRVEFDGLSALYDSLAAALIQPVEPARRHVVIARSKGHDTISSVDAQAVRAIAERSDALFHLVLMETAGDDEAELSSFQCANMGLCWPTRRSWVPFVRRLVGPRPVHQLLPDGQALADGAAATGGRLHRTAAFTEPTLAGTFRKAFEDFRTGYVLRYTPTGVARGGWHAIDVKMPRFRSYAVRARKGYGVEEPPPGPLRVIPEVPGTLDQLTTAYERGAFKQFVVGLRKAADPARLIREFEEAGNPWPATPRMEAAFALELAEAGIFSSREATRDAAGSLLERFSRLVRPPLEPDQFERYWYFAALTLLEGSGRSGVAEAFLDRALARFPQEPRFVLSRAIVADQRWSTPRQGPAVDGAGRSTAEEADAVRRYYTAAIAFPETAVEARIRLAWFLHRARQHDQALIHLGGAAAKPIADPALRYLRYLLLGHVLSAVGRPDEAVQAFRDAASVGVPAQSARVALMNTLLLRGDRTAAESLAEEVQTHKADTLDPWWMYWQGQYRLHPLAMARIREMSR